MIMRCVHIFPKFKNGDIIDEIRQKYDYLQECIEPHITLVFPFESDLRGEAIKEDLKENLKNIKKFQVVANGIEAVDSHGYYLFLNIVDGSEIIKGLHYGLHKGILRPFQSEWTKDGLFRPHITIGRFTSIAEMKKAEENYGGVTDKFVATIDKVIVEVIGDNEESIIESEVFFGE